VSGYRRTGREEAISEAGRVARVRPRFLWDLPSARGRGEAGQAGAEEKQRGRLGYRRPAEHLEVGPEVWDRVHRELQRADSSRGSEKRRLSSAAPQSTFKQPPRKRLD